MTHQEGKRLREQNQSKKDPNGSRVPIIEHHNPGAKPIIPYTNAMRHLGLVSGAKQARVENATLASFTPKIKLGWRCFGGEILKSARFRFRHPSLHDPATECPREYFCGSHCGGPAKRDGETKSASSSRSRRSFWEQPGAHPLRHDTDKRNGIKSRRNDLQADPECCCCCPRHEEIQHKDQ